MDFDLQQQLAQQRLKQYSQQSQFQAPQGQMIGRHYVAPNFLQQLAAGLRSVGGMRGEQLAQQEMQELSSAKKQAVADALRNFGEMSQGRPADMLEPDQAGPVRPAQAPDLRGAYAALMQAPDAGLQQAGARGIIEMPQIEAQAKAREEDRAFRQQEAEAARQARMQELQIRLEDQRISQTERIAAQKELREMQIQAQKDLQKLIASNRQAPQAQIIQTDAGPMQLVGGRAIPIAGPDGKPVAAPKKGAAGLSATAQKELFEADDAVQNGMGAVSSLQKAMELNDKAYSGVGASARATLRSNLPGSSESADATIAMENIIKDQALTSMKSIFGGNPTEGERAVLLDLQASASKTPKQREEILKRAMQATQQRLDFNKQKADSLRSGSYMAEGGAPQVQAPPSGKPNRVKFDAQGNMLP